MRVREQEPVTRLAMDVDTECRPMHYSEWRPESQITAYAWEIIEIGPRYWEIGSSAAILPFESPADRARLRGGVLLQDMSNEAELLDEFLRAYDAVDLVIGHYIRRHDLPLINDHCIRLGRKPISERPQKLVQDTKADFVKVKALGLTQDNLATMAGSDAHKHHMSGAEWRVANGLDPAGREDAWERVSSDVIQNIQLYDEYRHRHALRAPLRWPETVRRHPR
jgi:hypothetical protein